MLADHQIVFIGGGHIAEIIIHNLTQGGVVPPQKIMVSDPDPSRCQHLAARFEISIAPNNVAAVQIGDLILICVRPEVVEAVLPDLQMAKLRPDQVIISVAAGIPLHTYRLLGEEQPLVRALPNPPSQIGEGIAPLVFSSAVTPCQRQLVLELFSALGEWVEADEAYLNAITSLGSPVAPYLFFQALVEAGVGCGLPEPMAAQIAAQTITGSMAVWRSRQVPPNELIKEASTPGGVSVKSIETLEAHGFNSMVVDAILKGATRAAELGNRASNRLIPPTD